jgi:hypothetical protein
MQFKQKLAFFVCGCVCVVMAQAVIGAIAAKATAEDGVTDSGIADATMAEFVSHEVVGEFVQLRPHPAWMHVRTHPGTTNPATMPMWARVTHVGRDIVTIEGMALRDELMPPAWIDTDPPNLSPSAHRDWVANIPEGQRYEMRATLVIPIDGIRAVGPAFEWAAGDLDSAAFGPEVAHTLWVDF